MPKECRDLRRIARSDIPQGTRDVLFRVWAEARELLWAEKCWGYLEKNGLTAYLNEVSKVRVLVRLMSLAEIYREFCDRAWDETYDCELVAWASELDLNKFRLAQCIEDRFEEDAPDDEDELFQAALISLADEARCEIYPILVQEFGSDSNLLVSLWNTVTATDDHCESDIEDAEGVQEEGDSNRICKECESHPINWLDNAAAILSEVTPSKMRAYEWIDQGMPRIH